MAGEMDRKGTPFSMMFLGGREMARDDMCLHQAKQSLELLVKKMLTNCHCKAQGELQSANEPCCYTLNATADRTRNRVQYAQAQLLYLPTQSFLPFFQHYIVIFWHLGRITMDTFRQQLFLSQYLFQLHFFFFEIGSFCSSSWPGIHYVDTGLASISQSAEIRGVYHHVCSGSFFWQKLRDKKQLFLEDSLHKNKQTNLIDYQWVLKQLFQICAE